MELELKELTMNESRELYNLFYEDKITNEEYNLRLAYSELCENIGNYADYYKKAFEKAIEALRKENKGE